MMIRVLVLLFAGMAVGIPHLAGNTFTPDNLAAPFGVQPFSLLGVTGGVSSPFFSDLSGLPFSEPSILDVLGNLQAFDELGKPVSTFTVTGVTLTQGLTTSTPELDPFDLTSPVTYTSSLNPLNSVTVNPGDYNLAFAFNSDSTFQYSYTLNTTGIPDGGFLLYNDVESALVPEPDLRWPLALAVCGGLGWMHSRRRAVSCPARR